MQILKARFRGRDDFLDAYQADRPTGALFVPTTTPLDEREDVIVELVCDGLPNRVLIRGTVLSWRPALPRLRVRAGATVEFAPEEDEKRRFILATLAGDLHPPRRKHTRIPVALPSVAPQATSSLVDETFKWLKLDETARSFRALEAFSRAAGPRIRERARAERLRGAILYVRVASAAWSHELHALKAELLQKLKRTRGGEGVEDLRFSVGPLTEVPTWERRTSAEAPEPPRPRVADELARAMGGVADDELRDHLT